MRALKDTLKIYHNYRISNAVVNDTPAQHRVVNNDHQWVLYARTLIEEVEVKALTFQALKYNFVPLADLPKYTNSREGIGTNLTNQQLYIYLLRDKTKYYKCWQKNADAIFAVLKVGAPKMTRETWVQNILVIDQG